MDRLFLDIDLISKILIIIFFTSFLVQTVYYLFIFRKASFTSQIFPDKIKNLPPVSVVICSRNEAENLKKNLPLVLEQNYPDYEVVVVDDCSDDDTADILSAFARKYAHLRISTIKKDPVFRHGKKLALTIGIKAAKNEFILLTDADCIPAGKNWIYHMARHFGQKKDIIMGVGLYKKKPGLLNLLIRFETSFIAMQYLGMARIGKPYMGVGRNLAYRKSLFFKNRGFASHLKLQSGDDDLFVNQVATKNNSIVENTSESYTYSEPEVKWGNWLKQKRRHLTTGKFYQQSAKKILGLEFSSRMLLNISFVALLFLYPFASYILAVYILLFLIKSIIFIIVFKHFNEKSLFLPAMIMEPLIPFLYAMLHFWNYVERKRNRWK